MSNEPRFSESTVFRTSDDALIRELEGETVLLDLRTEVYFSLDEAGTLIWNALDGQQDLAAVSAQVVERYGVSPNVARVDVDEFIGELLDAGLVTAQE